MPLPPWKEKKKKKWVGNAFFCALLVIMIVGVAAPLLINFEIEIFEFLEKAFLIDTVTLLRILVGVFVGCGGLLFILLQWSDQDNIRFKAKRDQYRSALVSPDYYGATHRLKIDTFLSGQALRSSASPKLDIDHNLRTSSFTGMEKEYRALAALKTDISFKEGRLDGTFKTHFLDGSLLAEINYANGEPNGPFIVYYPGGAKHNEKHFLNGKLEGIFRAWDEDGALFFEIEFHNDVQHGLDRTYRKTGIVEYEDTYRRGRLVIRKTFDANGVLKFQQRYLDDEG